MSKFMDDYEPVEVRLARFWEEYPDGRVDTWMNRFEDGQVVFCASLYRTSDEDELAFSKGWAHEVMTERGVNSTSFVENCETSAIGRALANANYAPKGKRPSQEEMTKVERGKQKPAVTDQQMEAWDTALRAAETEDGLVLIGADIARFNVPADARTSLLAVYSERLKVLRAA
jgi:hypothetical protein